MVRCWGCSCVCAQCGDGDSIMVLQAASSAAAPWGMAWCCWVSCRVLGGWGLGYGTPKCNVSVLVSQGGNGKTVSPAACSSGCWCPWVLPCLGRAERTLGGSAEDDAPLCFVL